jgi:AmiR/NasT family two-component response regulator
LVDAGQDGSPVQLAAATAQFVHVIDSAQYTELHEGPDNRAMIDQAIGIIRSRPGASAEVAFGRLVQMSQTGNLKLRVVAARLVDEAVRRARSRTRVNWSSS